MLNGWHSKTRKIGRERKKEREREREKMVSFLYFPETVGTQIEIIVLFVYKLAPDFLNLTRKAV